MLSKSPAAGLAALMLSAAAAAAAGVPEELTGVWDKNLESCRQDVSDSGLFIGQEGIGFYEETCAITRVERKGNKTVITSKCTPNELYDDNNSYLWSITRDGDKVSVSRRTVGKKSDPLTFSMPFCKKA